MSFCSSSKAPLLAAALLAAAGAGAVTENPVVKLHGRDLTFLLTFDDGTVLPDVGMIENYAHRKFETAEGGVFGRALSAGSPRFPQAGKAVDMTRSGTLIAWVKLCHPVPQTKEEPSQGFVHWDLGGGKVVSLMKQGAFRWGEGVASLYYRAGPSARDIRCTSVPLRIPDWKPGEWRMLAATWTPEKIGVSVDGQPPNEITYEKRFGSQKYDLELVSGDMKTPPAERIFALDEIAVLSRRLTDAELKRLYEDTRSTARIF